MFQVKTTWNLETRNLGTKVMNSKITQITDSDFDRAVLFPRRPAVVFLTAEWSDASGAAYPVFEAAAEKYRAKTDVYEMNVDKNRIIPTAYGVRRIPAVMMFADGRLDELYAGAMTPEKLDAKIEKLTPPDGFYKSVARSFKKTATRLESRVAVLLSELF